MSEAIKLQKINLLIFSQSKSTFNNKAQLFQYNHRKRKIN